MPMYHSGVCLPQENCVRGLHTPVSGDCPAKPNSEFELVEAVNLGNSTAGALHFVNMVWHDVHQSMNVWHEPARDSPSTEYFVALLHQYNKLTSRRDDREFIKMWKTKGDEAPVIEEVFGTETG